MSPRCGGGCGAKVPPTHLPQHPGPQTVPIDVAVLTSATVERGGELADGIMPFLRPAARVRLSQAWAARGRAKAPAPGPLAVTLGLPTFLDDDLDAARAVARQNLGLFTTFPCFQRLFRASGFAEDAARMEQGAGAAALSDRPLDAVCLLGSVSRRREQRAAFRTAGVDRSILLPPAGVEGARTVVHAFRR